MHRSWKQLRFRWALECRSAQPILWSLWVQWPILMPGTAWQVCIYWSGFVNCNVRLGLPLRLEKFGAVFVETSHFEPFQVRKLPTSRHNVSNPVVDLVCEMTETTVTTLTGAPVVYSSSPYMMPGAESIGAMPMMAYTTEMPYPAYSTW